MANEQSVKQDSNSDGGRAARGGASANAQGKNQSSSTDTVTIGCKLPHGLIMDMSEPGKEMSRFKVRGMNAATIFGGFGLTEGVPRSFWEAWKEKHKALAFVQKDLIFAYKDKASAADAGEDRAELVTGMEPLNPNKPPKGITQLEKAEAE